MRTCWQVLTKTRQSVYPWWKCLILIWRMIYLCPCENKTGAWHHLMIYIRLILSICNIMLIWLAIHCAWHHLMIYKRLILSICNMMLIWLAIHCAGSLFLKWRKITKDILFILKQVKACLVSIIVQYTVLRRSTSYQWSDYLWLKQS